MLQKFEQDFEDIARMAWERQKTPLERMYDHWVGEGRWEPSPPRVTFRIFDRLTGQARCCHLCGADDKWFVEGDEVRQIARVFVCEHEPVMAGRGAIRQISSVPVQQVSNFEQTGGPLE